MREMFRHHDKDLSGFISKEDVMCMLLAADKVFISEFLLNNNHTIRLYEFLNF